MSDRGELALERIRAAAASGSEELDLREIGLTELPDELWELKQLTSLFLNKNQFTGVPEAISRLTNLTTLYLTGNQLTGVPAAISRLTNLTFLDLSGNQLTGVPEAISRLTNLTYLDLRGNPLDIPQEILERCYQEPQVLFQYLAEPRGGPPSPDPERTEPVPVVYHTTVTDDAVGENEIDRADDKLDIDDEVKNLSTVLIAKDVTPPISVGLFGDWGAGKSFFMGRMRKEIQALTKEKTEASPFCETVVQITFNAWHYTDANLWASLVSHIFDKLACSKDLFPNLMSDDEKKAYLFKELETVQENKKAAAGARERTRVERDEAAAKLSATTEARRETEFELVSLREMVKSCEELLGKDEGLKRALVEKTGVADAGALAQLALATKGAFMDLEHALGVMDATEIKSLIDDEKDRTLHDELVQMTGIRESKSLLAHVTVSKQALAMLTKRRSVAKAKREVEKAQSDAATAKSNAEAKSEAAKAKSDAAKAQSDVATTKSDVEKAESDAATAKSNAEKKKSDAAKAKSEAARIVLYVESATPKGLETFLGQAENAELLEDLTKELEKETESDTAALALRLVQARREMAAITGAWKRKKLATMSADQIATLLKDHPALLNTLEQKTGIIGAEKVAEGIVELRSAWTFRRAVGPVFRAFMKSWRGRILFVALLVAIAFAILPEPWIEAHPGTLRAATSKLLDTSWLVKVGALLSAAGAFAVNAWRRLAKVLKVAKLVVRRSTTPSDEERDLESKFVELRAKEQAETARLDDAANRVAELNRQIDEIEQGRDLKKFILDRVGSEDYRKQLGLIAIIRRDFEKLGGILARARGLKEKDPKEKDSKEQNLRIILYIDDLDRCPEARVVEVLQAVHLLLATPLFVVIVSVDSRWLLHSLQTQFAALKEPDPGLGEAPDSTSGVGMRSSPRGGREHRASLWETTPYDYLEKIFQIPYTLRPMPQRNLKELITAWMPPTALKAPEPARSPADGKPSTVVKRPADGDEPTRQPAKLKASPKPNRESLRITTQEINYVSDKLAHYIPTPRAAKRFANIYRLVKASVKPGDLERFEDKDSGDFKLVMFLLAIVTGHPRLANVLFLPIVEAEGLREKLGDKSEANARGWEKVMSTVRGSAAAGGVDEGDACWVVEQLHELCDLIPGEQMVDVRKWMKEVSRFSFGVGKSVDHARRHSLKARKEERDAEREAQAAGDPDAVL